MKYLAGETSESGEVMRPLCGAHGGAHPREPDPYFVAGSEGESESGQIGSIGRNV